MPTQIHSASTPKDSATRALMHCPPQIASGMADFVGRAWMIPKLLRWWRGQNGRFGVIVGDPGTGKSAVIAWLSGLGPPPTSPETLADYGEFTAAVKASHYFQATQSRSLLSSFADSVANQLLKTVPGFATALTETLGDRIQISGSLEAGAIGVGSNVSVISIGRLDLGGLSEEYAFDLAVAKPLARLFQTEPTKPILILVDALDEALEPADAGLSRFLSRLRGLPAGVRILATTRDDPRVLKHVEAQPIIHLSRNGPPSEEDDVGVYAKRRMQQLHPGAPTNNLAYATRIADRARGVFLYAQAVIDDLGRLPVKDWPRPEDLNLGVGLGSLYTAFLNRELGVDERSWYAQHERVLGVLAVSFGDGFTGDELDAVTKSDTRWTVNVCKQYLRGELPNGPFQIFHKSFADFLLGEEANIAYRIDSRKMHTLVANHYWNSCHGRWSESSDYCLQHLAKHLAASGDIEQLARLVDESWMTVRFERSGQRHDGFLQDVSVLWEHERFRMLDPSIGALERNQAIVNATKAAFSRASVHDLSRRYLPALAARAIETRTWSPERALSEIAHYRSPDLRARLLLLLLQSWKGDLAAAIIAKTGEDLEAACDLLPADSRESLLGAWALYGSSVPVGPVAEQTFGRASSKDVSSDEELAHQTSELNRIGWMTIDYDAWLHGPSAVASEERRLDENRASALVEIAPRLDQSLIGRAIEIAQEIELAEERGRALSALAPKMQLQEVLSVLKPVPFNDEVLVAAALTALGASCSETCKAILARRIADLAGTMEDDDASTALVGASRLMNGREREDLLLEALRSCPLPWLDRLLWTVRDDLTDRVRQEVLDLVESLESYSYHWAMSAVLVDSDPSGASHHLYNSSSDHEAGTQYRAEYVGCRLSDEEKDELFEDVLDLRNVDAFMRSLAALAPALTDAQLDQAILRARQRGSASLHELISELELRRNGAIVEVTAAPANDSSASTPLAQLPVAEVVARLMSAVEGGGRNELLEYLATGAIAPPAVSVQSVDDIAEAIADIALKWRWPSFA